MKFIVLGRVGMDIYPEERAKIASANLLKPALGGSSGNIAAGLGRLGEEVEMLSLVSDDPVGHYVRRECAEYGIGTHYLFGAPVGTNTNLALAENRREDFEVVIYRNNAADLALNREHIDKVDFSNFDALIVTGTALSKEPSRSATLEAMRRAKFSVIDLDYRAAAWVDEDPETTFNSALEIADVAIGNDEEFALVGGRDAAREFGAKKLAVYKMGGEGAITIDQGHEFETQIFPVDALKPVGAGDAFMAAFMSAYMQDKDSVRATKEGAANAAIVVSRPACSSAMPTRNELNKFLKSRGH